MGDLQILPSRSHTCRVRLVNLMSLRVQTGKELQECFLTGVRRVAPFHPCVSIQAFVPPSPFASVPLCISAYLRCKEQAIPLLGFRRGADVGSSVALRKYASVSAEICGRLVYGSWFFMVCFSSLL